MRAQILKRVRVHMRFTFPLHITMLTFTFVQLDLIIHAFDVLLCEILQNLKWSPLGFLGATFHVNEARLGAVEQFNLCLYYN